MFNKATLVILLLSVSAFTSAAPTDNLLGGLLGGGGGGGVTVPSLPSDTSGSAGLAGGLDGLLGGPDGILSILKVLPLNAGLDGLVGDVVRVVRVLLDKVINILEQLLPGLSQIQLDELSKLLANENLTHSEILQEIDGWVSGQKDVNLTNLYNSIKEDVQGKVGSTLDSVQKIANNLSPELGDFVKQLADIINNDALTLLDQDKAIGNLVSNLLANIQQLLDQLLKDLGSLLNLNNLNLKGLLQVDSILNGLLGNGLTGIVETVKKLLNILTGGLLGTDLLDGLLSPEGLLSSILGDDGLLGGLLGGNGGGLLGGVLGGSGGNGGLLGGLLGGGSGNGGGLLSGVLGKK